MIESPNILLPADFFGIKNNIIFVRHDHDACGMQSIYPALDGALVILTTHPETIIKNLPSHIKQDEVLIIKTDNVCDLYKALKLNNGSISYYIVDGIDRFNNSNGKRERGSIVKAYISMCGSKKLLQDSNIVITSTHPEYGIQEIADININLQTSCH